MVRLSNDRSIAARRSEPERTGEPSRARASTTPRVRRRADARRMEILRAAAGVFRERGFAAAGMREIAAAADLSLGNLYHYFRGKDELLFFCQDRSLDRLLSALAAARSDRGDLAARLHRLAVAHVSCLLDDVEGSAAHLEIDALPPALRDAVVLKRDRYERGVRALVASGIRSGALRPADPTIATRAFLGALNWTARWFRPDGAQPPQRLAAMVADYAVAGLAAASSGRGEASHDSHAGHAQGQRRDNRRRVRAVQNAAGDPA